MSKGKFQTLPGTRDLIGLEAANARELVKVFATQAELCGFGEVVVPMFEDLDVFVRLGEATDVVSKELYDFEDKGGRKIALRPEFTASVCRAYIENRPLKPWKAWYEGPCFRYDKPQKGRYRQFFQIGVEAIGSDDPDVDVEVIALAWNFYKKIGLSNITLLLNSLGDFADRPAYLDALRKYFDDNAADLSGQSLKTLEVNPLRVLDSKRDQDRQIVAAAPILGDYISDDAAAAFNKVQAGLKALNVPFELSPRLVRGLDYYTRTTFEFASGALDSAQNALGGGGRYDGLIEALGGPAEPGIGFSLGVDRIVLAAEAENVKLADESGPLVWVIATTPGTEATEITHELRTAGYGADRSFDGRSLKAQMKAANRSGASIAVIVGEDELASGSVSVRQMRAEVEPNTPKASTSADSKQFLVKRDNLVETIRSLLK